jgi:hypothetical protein
MERGKKSKRGAKPPSRGRGIKGDGVNISPFDGGGSAD